MSAHEDYALRAGYEVRSPDASRLLVVLHGLGGDRNQALGLLKGSALVDVAVLAPDARAHGATSLVGNPSDFTFPSMAADLLALIEATNQSGKPTYIAGISMGAALALHTVMTSALDMRGVSYIRPAFTKVSFPDNLQIMGQIAQLLDDSGPVEGLARFTQTVEYKAIAARSASGAASLREQFTKPRVAERSIRLAEVPRNTVFDGPQGSGTTNLPTLVVGTADDPVHPLSVARDWAAQLPGSDFVQVPSRDDDPLAYERSIRAALQKHVSSVFFS